MPNKQFLFRGTVYTVGKDKVPAEVLHDVGASKAFLAAFSAAQPVTSPEADNQNAPLFPAAGTASLGATVPTPPLPPPAVGLEAPEPTNPDEVVHDGVLRSKGGKFVSPQDQDADGKPETIVTSKRGAKK